MPSGGYRKPSNPAPVSGPDSLSRRTDGGPAQVLRDLPNAGYGENKDFRGIESGAPMATAASPSGSGPAATSAPEPPFSHPMGSPPPPLSGGTLNPNEPVTAGVPAGAGANSMNLPQVNEVQSAQSVLQAAAANGGSQAAALLARIKNGRL